MNREQVELLKQTYQPGISIRLISMHREPQMTAGLMGRVIKVDDAGQIHTRWSNGSTLALNCEIDKFVAFSGPDASEYLRKILNLTGDEKVWYRENPHRFQMVLVDAPTLIEAAERYIEKNIEMTGNLAAITFKPYDTVSLIDAFNSAHVLTDTDVRQIKSKHEFSAAESDQYRCPKCGADSLDYGQTKLEDNFVVCPWTCRKCGSTGKEYGSIVFDGHCVDTSPDFKEVQK